MNDSDYRKIKHDISNENTVHNRQKIKSYELNCSMEIEKAIVGFDSWNIEKKIKYIIFNLKRKIIPDLL